jgi:hypothetical protein
MSWGKVNVAWAEERQDGSVLFHEPDLHLTPLLRALAHVPVEPVLALRTRRNTWAMCGEVQLRIQKVGEKCEESAGRQEKGVSLTHDWR